MLLCGVVSTTHLCSDPEASLEAALQLCNTRAHSVSRRLQFGRPACRNSCVDKLVEARSGPQQRLCVTPVTELRPSGFPAAQMLPGVVSIVPQGTCESAGCAMPGWLAVLVWVP